MTRATNVPAVDYAAAIDMFFAPAPDGVRTPDVVAAATPARRLRDALEPLAMHAGWAAPVQAALGGIGRGEPPTSRTPARRLTR